MILAGRVRVDGEIAALGDSADPDFQKILVDGVPLPCPESRIVVALYKPEGYVTTMDDEQGRPAVAELLEDVGVRVYPVGRLDLNSSGLLLCTNDGALANGLMHPSHKVEKRYRVLVSGDAEPKLAILQAPLCIDGRMTAPAKVRIVKQLPGSELRTLLEVTIHEGRNRQIRRLCAAAELNVLGLRRVAVGKITLEGLAPGQWRQLRPEEVDWLRSHCGMQGDREHPAVRAQGQRAKEAKPWRRT